MRTRTAVRQILYDRVGALITQSQLSTLTEELVDEDGGCKATLEIPQGDALYGYDLYCNLPEGHHGAHYAEGLGVKWRSG